MDGIFVFVLLCLHVAVPKSCGPSKEVIICENDTCDLQCNAISTIRIMSANYGRTSKTVCRGNYVNSLTCSATTAMRKIIEECENKSTCEVKANNGIFGDPCSYIIKYVNLTYQCSEDPQTTPTTTKKTEDPQTSKPTTKITEPPKKTSTTPEITETPQMAESTSVTTEIPEIAPSTSKATGIIVGVVVLSIIIFIGLFVLLHRRIKQKRKDPGVPMNSIINNNISAKQETMDTSNSNHGNQPCRSDSVYHQYSEILPSTPTEGACADYTTCIPEYSCPSSRTANNWDYKEVNGEGGFSSNKSDCDLKSNVNDGAYFILDPNETGVHKVSHQQDSSNAANYELAQPTNETYMREDYIAGQYGDTDEYNHVLNINQTKSGREDLYDRVTDDLYDVSCHERIVVNDDTYDCSNVVK